jgi:hypothetical protein
LIKSAAYLHFGAFTVPWRISVNLPPSFQQTVGLFERIFTFKRFIFYGFPIYLVTAEYAIRFLLSYAPGKPEDLALVGSTSTVTAAGLSLMTLTKSAADEVKANKALVVREADHRLISLAYIALLFLPFGWGWALWMVHKQAGYGFTVLGIQFQWPFLIAVAIYLVGMIFNELKEVV